VPPGAETRGQPDRTPADRREALEAGRQAEAWVAEQLQAQGWHILDRNWSGGGGELDLVVLRERCLRFVEVRGRGADPDVPAEETITASKRRRLRGAARAWMQAKAAGFDEVAFLVALVDLDARPWVVEWIDDAFDGA